MASLAVLVTACGATERIDKARELGDAVRYGALAAQPLTAYANALRELQANDAVLQQPAGRQAAVAYAAAARDVESARTELVGVEAPPKLRKPHDRLVDGMGKASAALTKMATGARRSRPRIVERGATEFAAAQQQVNEALEEIARSTEADLPEPPKPAT